MRQKRRLKEICLIAVLVSLPVLAVLSRFLFERARQTFLRKEYSPNILFVGNSAYRKDSLDDVIEKLSLYDWDLVVLGGNIVQADSSLSYNDILNKWVNISDSVVLFNRDFDAATFKEFSVGSIQNIFLKSENADSVCEFGENDIRKLARALKKSSKYRVLYLDYPCWKERIWPKKIEKKLRGKVDMVISGNGMGFEMKDMEGVRYFLNGLPEISSNTNLLTFSMITPKDNSLILNKITMADAPRLDSSWTQKLPRYEVTVSLKELKEIYKTVPIYDVEVPWIVKIDEDPKRMNKVLDGTLTYEGKSYEINMAVRGNIGNHWEGIKKSWDIDFVDGFGPDANRQLKFMIPEDREYVGQVFVAYINDQFDVPTPKTTVGSLVINGIDFGPYIIYEDFDERFLELHGYSPDVSLFKTSFGDRFGYYPMFGDLNYIMKYKTKEDKSFQQIFLDTDKNYEDFIDFFDQYNYSRWIATQIFTGDRHQNSLDNIRTFRDASTGRYILVAWDQYFRQFRPLDSFVWLPKLILQQPEEKKVVFDVLRKELARADMYKSKLQELIEMYEPAFLNDPFLIEPEYDVYLFHRELLRVFENNVLELQQIIYAEDTI